MYSQDRIKINPTGIELVDFKDKNIVFGTCMANGFAKNLGEHNLDCTALPANNAIHSLSSLSVLLDFITENNGPLKHYCVHDATIDGIRFLPFGLSSENIHDSYPELRQSLDNELESYKTEIELSDNIVIFVGTTRVIRLKKNGCVINRVDGLPEGQWESRQTGVNETTGILEGLIRSIAQVNPTANIIFAVDPQRYLFKFVSDPASDNILAKSTLICSIDNVTNAHDNVHYFKSFELVYEELRHCEYINRNDLTHINDTTLNHLMHSFLLSFGNGELRKDIQTVVEHRFPYFDQLTHADTISRALARQVDKALDKNDYSNFPIHLLPQYKIFQLKRVATLCRRIDILDEIDRHCERILRIPDDTPFYVWGTGGRMKNTIARYLDGKDNFAGFIDNDSTLHETSLLGHTVFAPDILAGVPRATVLIASTYFNSIRRQIFNLNQAVAVKNIPSHL